MKKMRLPLLITASIILGACAPMLSFTTSEVQLEQVSNPDAAAASEQIVPLEEPVEELNPFSLEALAVRSYGDGELRVEYAWHNYEDFTRYYITYDSDGLNITLCQYPQRERPFRWWSRCTVHPPMNKTLVTPPAIRAIARNGYLCCTKCEFSPPIHRAHTDLPRRYTLKRSTAAHVGNGWREASCNQTDRLGVRGQLAVGDARTSILCGKAVLYARTSVLQRLGGLHGCEEAALTAPSRRRGRDLRWMVATLSASRRIWADAECFFYEGTAQFCGRGRRVSSARSNYNALNRSAVQSQPRHVENILKPEPSAGPIRSVMATWVPAAVRGSHGMGISLQGRLSYPDTYNNSATAPRWHPETHACT